jgi:endonuclease/exonuclease/phosphatase family metal-dependent hydrolase
MKILAWNMTHQTQERVIKPLFLDAITKMEPDVIALNEYVHGKTRMHLLEGLAHIGLQHYQVSNLIGVNNQVLIASKIALERGDLFGPQTAEGGGESNFLHVKLANLEIEVVGLRVPAYSSSAELHVYWQCLIEVISVTKKRSIVFIGDLNADPEANRHVGAQYLASLRLDGWQIPSPAGAWSYVSGTRIDHVIASPSVRIIGAEYVASMAGFELAARGSASRVSDHAALVVNVESVQMRSNNSLQARRP